MGRVESMRTVPDVSAPRLKRAGCFILGVEVIVAVLADLEPKTRGGRHLSTFVAVKEIWRKVSLVLAGGSLSITLLFEDGA